MHIRRSVAAEALTSLAVLTLSIAGCSSADPNPSTAVDTWAAASLSAAPTASTIPRVY